MKLKKDDPINKEVISD